MGKKTSSTALVYADDVSVDKLRPVIQFGRKFFSFDKRLVEDGGSVLVKYKKRLKITVEKYQSFVNSGSDKPWKDVILPSNLQFIKCVEGSYPFSFFEIEGFPDSVHLPVRVPAEVAQRLFPSLKENALANPEAFGLQTDDDGKLLPKDAARVDALDWTPMDCVAQKDGELRPVFPNPAKNSWQQVSKEVEKLLFEALHKIQPPSAAKLANEKRSRDEKLAEACNVLKTHGFDFKLVPGNDDIKYQLVFPGTTKGEVSCVEFQDTTLLTRFASSKKKKLEHVSGASYESASADAAPSDEEE